MVAGPHVRRADDAFVRMLHYPAMGPDIEVSLARSATDRATRVMRTMLRVLMSATVLVVGLSLLDPNNDVRVTLAIHGTDVIMMGIAWWYVERGRPRVAAWMISWMFWAIVAASAWLFGGLQFELSAAYIVSVMVAGTTLGGGPAMFFAVLSIAMTSFVLAAHLGGWLPPPITPPSVINAWISVTVSMLLGGYLLHVALSSLEEALRKVTESAYARDATHRRLLQAQRMEPVGRLAAGVAHDFNNLLAAITTIAGVLRRRVADQPTLMPLLDDLEGATDRAAMMTRQLLAFSRAREPAFEVFELDPLLKSTVPLISRLLGDEIRVELRLGADGAKIRADRSQIEQVLLNLTVNARDAMPNGGHLRIATAYDELRHVVHLEVRDDGVGVDEAVLPRLFEPFFTTKSSGTGLGLATVRDIVDASGGTIDVKSQLGDGTSFLVELPEHEGELTPTPHRYDAPYELVPTGLRVLLVEDHELVRRSTRQMLEDAGFDVTAVNDGAEALVLLESGSGFDAVVSDLRMPRLSGEGLAEALVARGMTVPMVFTSGHEDRMTAVLEKYPGPKRFVPKAVASALIVQAVKDVIREGIGESGPPDATIVDERMKPRISEGRPVE